LADNQTQEHFKDMNQEQLPTNQPPIADDEITLKDIILKIQEWWSIV
jgi:hypothetical protein